MDKLTVDQATLAQLSALDHGVELRDDSGNVLGWFRPATELDKYEGHECPLSSEELDRIEQEGGGRPLGDILRDLERGT